MGTLRFSLSNICVENRDGINCEAYDSLLITSNGLQVEKLYSTKTAMERWNFKKFQSAMGKQRTWNLIFAHYTNKKRNCRVYHVKFPHILKELEVKIVQFLGGDFRFTKGCLTCLFQGLLSLQPSLSHNFSFIFCVVSIDLELIMCQTGLLEYILLCGICTHF